MDRIEILADMAGRHVAHDVYDLWLEDRDGSILFGWTATMVRDIRSLSCPTAPSNPWAGRLHLCRTGNRTALRVLAGDN